MNIGDTEEVAPKQKLNLDVAVANTSACERHVTVTVSEEDIDRYLTDALEEIKDKAEVPGFRPGRAPRKLVESRFRDQMAEKVKGTILLDAITQVNEDQDFSAISEPDFDFELVTVPTDGPLTFEFNIEVRPEFDLPEWKGLEIEKPTREFTQADIDQQIITYGSRLSDPEKVDEPAVAGDFVFCDLTISHDGKDVQKFKGEELRILPVLGFPDATIEGFDDLLIGVKAGEERQTTIKLDENVADESLRGQEVDATFSVKEVRRLDVSELAEKLQADLEMGSREELDERIRSVLERQLRYQQQKEVRKQIIDLLTKSVDLELPPALLKRQSRRELERSILELQSSGYGLEMIRAYENELRRNSLKATEQSLKEHFLLERIAETEEIEATPEDYDAEIESIAQQEGQSSRRIRARLEKQGLMDSLRNQIVEQKVIDKIAESASFKEKPFEIDSPNEESINTPIAGEEEHAPDQDHSHDHDHDDPSHDHDHG